MSVSADGRYIVGVSSDNWGVAQKVFEVSGEEPVTLEVQFNKLKGKKQ
jgi:hypothetical protein